MSRWRQTKVNILVTLLYQAVTLICGLVLPRFVLSHYSSEVNGLIQTVNQILSYTTLMEFGIGGAMRAALYKPLAENDHAAVSDIFNHTKNVFFRISVVFVLFSGVLALSARYFIRTDFDFVFVATLTLILAVNVYFNYYFAIAHQILLKSDQKLYVVESVQIVTLLLNLVACIVAIELGADIRTVKFITAFVYLINPLAYRIYVRKHYHISKTVCDRTRVLPKKTDAIVHHLSYFIHRNTDAVILSVFEGLVSVSVYSVYNMVIFAIEQILNSVSTAVAGALGNIIAKDEKKTLISSFDLYEAVNTSVTTWFFTVTAIFMLPFVSVYTKGVADAAEYIKPIFSIIIILAGVMYSVRIPYATVVTSAGHYKETASGALVEVILNIGLSLLLVKRFSLAGIATGTFVAMSYRTIYIVWYLSKNLLNRPMGRFFISLCTNAAAAVVVAVPVIKYADIKVHSFFELIPAGIATGVVAAVVIFGANVALWYVFNGKKYRKDSNEA